MSTKRKCHEVWKDHNDPIFTNNIYDIESCDITVASSITIEDLTLEVQLLQIALMIGSYSVPADLYGIERIPVIINSMDIFITIAGVFLLNLIAGVYPAQRAAGLDPVEAISSN
ncbi:hypothetical protein [Methanococcoides alaskense]|uniref:ABC-type lipoprotein release transport system permease subunit n=1 Tax=Methanococcoides alaskense TaxID=325778 RepID=A0AA90TXW6_9EURY|nr:hypothetical protein [Methanococcoides alaskense]MDA0525024.1 hypothetical protein [Methanococcoides alaskense]MDR6222059.1 ABC-type lipoprotein release transport system permease subunit [Methanococcoides alaskense]